MPINVFGNSSSSYDNGNKIDTSLFVQKLYLRTIYVESILEEDIDLKIQYRVIILPDPISIRETHNKNYVVNKFLDPSLMKNTTHVDFNDKNLDNVRSFKVNSFPTIEEQLTPKICVDQALSDGVDDPSLLRLDPDENLRLDEQDSIVLNSALPIPKSKIELPTKSNNDKKVNDPSIKKTLLILTSMMKISITLDSLN